MKPALLLTVAVLLTSAMTFAQQASAHPLGVPTQQQLSPALPVDAPLLASEINPSLLLSPSIDPMMVMSDKRPIDDTVCYKIRSYVVARDSKHSDAVHPVGYSTCQPAGKYRLRTTMQTTTGSVQH